jgi:lipid A 3-O-deacylase
MRRSPSAGTTRFRTSRPSWFPGSRRASTARQQAGLDLELIPHGGATLGTTLTLARAGGMLRLGRNMTGFGTDTIEPGGAMLKNIRRDIEPARAQGIEWWVFAGLDHRLVAHNIFLDGTVFRDSPSVQRRPHVYDLTAGVSLRVDAADFADAGAAQRGVLHGGR